MNARRLEHQPVMLDEMVDALAIQRDGIYIDGTFGRGGHAQAILQRLGEKGRLLAFDKDPDAVRIGEKLAAADKRFSIWQHSFSEMLNVVGKGHGQVNGIILDLGVSSPQLEDPARGFSFLRDGPLDMRMNPDGGISAARWIKKARLEELIQVFREYGEERYARRISKAIVKARQETPIERTKQLADIVAKAHPRWERHKHPATRVFQAIRIYINRELDELEAGLNQSLELLAVGGRLVVISFHSLEDRIVKQFIAYHERGGDWPKHLPIMPQGQARLKRMGRAIKPSDKEIASNPRARSAMLRIAEKLS